jgi:hypothetical protein
VVPEESPLIVTVELGDVTAEYVVTVPLNELLVADCTM